MTVPHSIDPVWRRVLSATTELIVMTSSDVPIASGIVKPSASTSAGTMTKPPPTPKNPVRSPTTVPAAATLSTVARSKGRASAAGAGGGGGAQGACGRGRCRSAGSAPHRRRGDEHQPGEGEEQQVRVGGLVPAGSEQGAGDADEAEQGAGTEADTVGAPVGDDADEGGDGDQHERGGGRLLGRLPGGIDQGGDGEDGAAAAERAEGHTDQQPERGGEQGAHGRAQITTPGCPASSITGCPWLAHRCMPPVMLTAS